MTAQRKRIVFMGYSVGGTHTLRTLLELEAHVVAIVLPKSAPPEKNEAVLHLAGDQIPVLYSNKPGKEVMEAVRAMRPDLIVVNSFPYLLPAAFIGLPPMGCINLHGAYLPKYRGAHVLQWAIINGETETGITVHYIDEGMDTGDIIAQAKVPIRYDDNAITLRERMYSAGDALLRDTWANIEASTAQRIPQNNTDASVYHKRKAEDGRIDWNKSNLDIYNLVRALVPPWPGAFTIMDGASYHITKCLPHDSGVTSRPGTIQALSENHIIVACKDGAVSISEMEVNSNKLEDFKRYFKIGDSFEAT